MNTEDIIREESPAAMAELECELDSLKKAYQDAVIEKEVLQESVAEAENRFQEVLNRTRDVIFTLTIDGLINSTSKAFKDITGWEVNDWTGKPFIEMVHPDDVEEGIERFGHVIQGNLGGPFKMRILQKAGHYVVGEFLAFPRIRNGKTIEILGIGSDISDRLKTERELLETQTLLEAVFNSTSDMIWSVDSENFGLLSFNKSLRDYFLKERGILIKTGDRPEDLFPSADFINCWQYFYKRVLQEGPFTEEYSVFSGTRLLELSFNLVRPGGVVTAISVFGKDITEKKRAERILKESEASYRALYDNALEGIFRVSPRGRSLQANWALAKMLGYDSPDHFLKNTDDVGNQIWLGPESRAAYLEQFEKQEVVRGYECQFRRLDGSLIWVSLNSRMVRDENGERLYYEGFVEDITRKKEAEEMLRQSEERFKLMFENAPMAINITRGPIITYANPSYLRMFGFSSMEELGEFPPLELFAPEWRPVILENIQRRAKGLPVPDYYESESLRKDGTNFPVLMYLSRAMFADGPATVGFILDITESKQAEVELIKAKLKAEESERLKSSFLANMSHEIRTPMNGILGFAELLKEPGLPAEEQLKYVEIIENSGIRMLNLINNIVSFSKIEAGGMEMCLLSVNINQKLADLLSFFKQEAVRKGLTIEVVKYLPENESVAITDPELLFAILSNFIKNAIKFTSSGSIRFGCERSGPELGFFVADTGTGIPCNQLEIIFERFRQGSELMSRNYEGAGLGLSISKAYAELLGGIIRVESEVGKGSTFYFTLPLHQI